MTSARTADAGPGRPLNVLWLSDHVCYDGSLHGCGRLYMNLMPTFDPGRIRVHSYFLRSSPEVRRVFAEAHHPVIDLDKGKYDPTALVTVRKLCRDHEIDVMHTFCYASSTIGRIVGRSLGIPTVIHDFDTQVYFPYPTYLKVLDRLLAGSTARAFAASSFCRDYMRDVRRVPGERIDVLYHAIPKSVLTAAANADSAAERRRLGWPEDSLIFGCITKLGPDRGNETLLRAFRQVVDKLPAARLALVYKPTQYHRVPEEYAHIPWIRDIDAMRENIDSQVRDLQLQDHVYLVEMSGSLLPYYAASDVLLAPYEHERFSSVNLVEGLAFGRPFIGSDLGEAREINMQHDVGRMVPAGDVQALAAAMLEVAQQPAVLHELGEQARKAARYFTAEATTERFAQLYESLARRQDVRAA